MHGCTQHCVIIWTCLHCYFTNAYMKQPISSQRKGLAQHIRTTRYSYSAMINKNSSTSLAMQGQVDSMRLCLCCDRCPGPNTAQCAGKQCASSWETMTPHINFRLHMHQNRQCKSSKIRSMTTKKQWRYLKTGLHIMTKLHAKNSTNSDPAHTTTSGITHKLACHLSVT